MTIARVAIVTGGAGSGIGSGITHVLVRDGWQVLIADRDKQSAVKLLAELKNDNNAVQIVETDLTDVDSPSVVVGTALDRWGRIDGLALNAGIGLVSSIEEIRDEQFDHVFDVNVRASFRLARQAAPHLQSSRGAIVTLGSIHGIQPLPHFSAYAGTKGAIEALTRAWAVELGKDGVRANCVVAGMVDCPQTRATTARHSEDVEQYLGEWTARRQILPRLVTNHDVGELVAFLLSEKSRGITGQSIVIDAGTTLMLTDRS